MSELTLQCYFSILLNKNTVTSLKADGNFPLERKKLFEILSERKAERFDQPPSWYFRKI